MDNLLLIYTELLRESWFFYLNLICGGLIAGSFCTMLIYRLPIIIQQQDANASMNNTQQSKTHYDNLSLAFPNSHCPECGKSIPAYLNLPLLGYLFTRGKCSKCSATIAWYYPITELLCLATALLAGWIFGATPILLPLLLLLWALVALSIIDLRSGLLPDQLTLGILWTGLLFHSFIPSYINYANLSQAILGVVVAYLFLSLVNFLYYILRRRVGIGGGDIKLFSGLAAYFGWQGLLPLLLFSSISGIVFFIILEILHKTETLPKTETNPRSSSESVMLTEQKWGPHIALAAVIYILLFHFYPDLLGLFTPTIY